MIPVFQWKHHIELLISILTHWNSLKHEMDSFSTSLFTSRQIRKLWCCQERGSPILSFLSQATSCTIPLSHFHSAHCCLKYVRFGKFYMDALAKRKTIWEGPLKERWNGMKNLVWLCWTIIGGWRKTPLALQRKACILLGFLKPHAFLTIKCCSFNARNMVALRSAASLPQLTLLPPLCTTPAWHWSLLRQDRKQTLSVWKDKTRLVSSSLK